MTCKQILTIAGLILDCFGIFLMVTGEIKKHSKFMREYGGVPCIRTAKNPILKIPYFLLKKFAFKEERDPAAVTGKAFATTFWGIILILLGFFLQILGAVA